MDRIVVIVGPTASGKTALSVALAKKLRGEVISADSMQIYRGMDVGTAKVTTGEMDGIRHHMIDVADPAEAFSAARFVEMADPILRDILSRRKTAVIAGGTGLYVDALIQGRAFAPCPATGKREALEAEADRLGMEHMLDRLRQVDPDSADRLHLSDRKRILRALEVYEETGRTITAHNLETQKVPSRYDPVWLGLSFADRAALYRRIDRRVDRMLEQGLLEEIRSLLDRGVPRTATALQAIGYKEFLPVLEGKRTPEEAAEEVKRGSRRYAKRQLTWFRRNEKIHWILQGDPPDPEAVAAEALRQIPFFDGET
ncbi:MAG: tRNA (adenosine(37)-N6)-dimethylallyltransferase MiaA [Oscillospiraceae bacterium]|nr:tRNA (adenosine(37)-N6)-dimethylallyltransferase MiaA [Oscillospiraceae bacterium]